MPELTVAILAVPRVITLDLSIPLHVLGRHSGYEVIVCAGLMATHPLSAAAYEAGKHVVAGPARSGDQRQYVDVLTPPRSDLSATREWAMQNIGEPLTVKRLDDHGNLPRRTFIRHFERETGIPPMRWVVLQRILSARRLLEESDWSVERIAAATGFGTAANFRSAFRREVGTTPSTYRESSGTSQGMRRDGWRV
ncbi:helix-turn-helix domain-containing protein [Kribbella sp. VKM Ac-2568]|uniref:helix-turn-helix domain-containing protein n=1 Tax=Kribbella sp. VKM Ac-2568 TaxID=2512219 RepID=UPI00104F52A1|nr:helix-turn-helix domain-containing protein [Kribbella sp. VKM Ac-2568]TCM41858.1 helix-turn-helix protein [Kribbella sp. VKM Ac-2568]